MHAYIDDKNFWLEYGCFPEKISSLKKCKQIKLKIVLYADDSKPGQYIELNNQLDFLKSLKKLPETIYASKSNYYWWCFDGCSLLEKKIYQDKSYYDYQGRDSKKWNIELTVSYKDVWGSNKKTVLERDAKLRKLFSDS